MRIIFTCSLQCLFRLAYMLHRGAGTGMDLLRRCWAEGLPILLFSLGLLIMRLAGSVPVSRTGDHSRRYCLLITQFTSPSVHHHTDDYRCVYTSHTFHSVSPVFRKIDSPIGSAQDPAIALGQTQANSGRLHLQTSWWLRLLCEFVVTDTDVNDGDETENNKAFVGAVGGKRN